MEEIRQLFEITNKLRSKYEHLKKNFSLDGKLVGDIGEVLAKEKYGLQLYGENQPVHDAYELATGRKIQIKATFNGYSYFPFGIDRIPDYFLSIEIDENGKISELYNGPGQYLFEHYILKRKLKPYKNHYYTLARGQLLKLNVKVSPLDKIKEV